MPQTALTNIYSARVAPLDELDDLDIKRQNKAAQQKWISTLTAQGIPGWLSTQETSIL